MTIIKEVKIQLLKFFENNNHIQLIMDLGYEKSQITSLTNQLISEGLLTKQTDNNFLLTKKGEKELKLLTQKTTQWIDIEKKSKIESFDKNDVFLPHKYQL
ncbi:hypothetical protein [uncultured Microscilla sp.]|uniref:hypothetical protein n=1 Tax=uncultured Microscilla sp. TaxID=432653 RepID=UPI002614649C|nr:hypothetical protein [uncultured Microscilla sp.]